MYEKKYFLKLGNLIEKLYHKIKGEKMTNIDKLKEKLTAQRLRNEAQGVY